MVKDATFSCGTLGSMALEVYLVPMLLLTSSTLSPFTLRGDWIFMQRRHGLCVEYTVADYKGCSLWESICFGTHGCIFRIYIHKALADPVLSEEQQFMPRLFQGIFLLS